MSSQVPFHAAEEVNVHCDMCRRVMTIRKLEDGECKILATGRNVALSYGPGGKFSYVYVCDRCLGGGKRRV